MSTKKLQILGKIIATDDTLSESGMAADAKTVGDVFAEQLTLIENTLVEAKSYTDTEVAALVNSAPETLDTLGELATAFKENEDVVAALDQAITTKANATDLQEVSSRVNQIMQDVPFSFGIDSNGNYGYIKAGADTVTPFKRVAKKVGTIICGLNNQSLDYSKYEDKDQLTVDNFYLMPTAFSIIDSKSTGEKEGTTTFGTYYIRKTYNNYILSVRRDSIPGDTAVDLTCDVYVIY